ncbi:MULTISPECIES: hypothetical protein [Chryseobacterium]|uniref:hypothetical protein n=1 Tax=Chryseobacterium TaxID=59732 RepID=UPI0009D84205|nr:MULTISPECIES: hypothetical protein [Chryseobacterium]MBL3549775.1 hypothetical protein [Chryseobacterium sp. KMC2]MDC8101769.1 hypothetical protein [Chryseobacterium rhizosphaerae]SMC87077.1 hypothetical protein SAMN02787074_3611 [Chryseobacterium sp. YR221]
MKRIPVFMLAICSTLIFGQKVSDYKYIFIPEKFEAFKKDSYGLETFLAKALTGKKYVVLPANRDQWPSEAKDNSCNILDANVLDDSGLFTNKVILEFKDCNKQTILEAKGRSSIKEFEKGYPDALTQALVSVKVSAPVNILPAAQISETTNNTEITTSAGTSTATANAAVSTASNFSNGKLDLQKVQIDNTQFILAKSGSSVPFAIFKSTSKKDVFMVKLDNGMTTIGYFENGNIVIDVPQADGKYSKETFAAK